MSKPKNRSQKPNRGNGQPKGNRSNYAGTRSAGMEATWQSAVNERQTEYKSESLKNAVQFGWPTILGTPTKNQSGQDEVIPGIFRIDFVPSFGFSNSPTSPLNVAALRNYAYWRSFISGQRDYTPADGMLYTLAVSGLVPALLHARRAISCVNDFNTTNRYKPKVLVEAMGFDYDEIVDNKPNIISKYDFLIDKINQFPIPSTLTQMKRWDALTSNIFMDTSAVKAQMYLYRPTFVPKLVFNSATTTQGLPAVEWEPLFGNDNKSKVSLIDYLNTVNESIQVLLNATVLNDIIADVLRVYTENGVLKLSHCVPGEQPNFVKSDYQLTMIHNTVTIPLVTGSVSEPVDGISSGTMLTTPIQEILDDDNNITYLVANYKSTTLPSGLADTVVSNFGQRIFYDTLSSDPEWQEVADMTRSKMVMDAVGDNVIVYPASELIHAFTIFEMSTNQSSSIVNTYYFSSFISVDYMSPSFLKAYTAFDWAPIVYGIGDTLQNSNPSIASTSRFLGEVNNYMYEGKDKVIEAMNYIVQDIFNI